MASKKPGFLLKDVSLALNGTNKIGQVSEMTIPMPEQKFISVRNGGMIKPRAVPMGFEEMDGEYSFPGIDPDLFKLYGIGPGQEFPLIAYGYMQSEDGTNHTCRAELVAKLAVADIGSWQSGEEAPVKSKIKVDEMKFFINDEEIFTIDDFEFTSYGQSTMPGRREALRAD